MFAQNDKLAWEYLYDKYASMMYGIIINIAGDKTHADDILTDIFVELKTKEMLSRIQSALCHTLIRFTYVLTVKYLKEKELKSGQTILENNNSPHIYLLYKQLSTLNESAAKSLIIKRNILLNLRSEFIQFQTNGNLKSTQQAVSP